MVKPMAPFFVVVSFAVLAATGLVAAPASAVDRPVDAEVGGYCGMVIMAGGDVYTTWVEGPTTCSNPPHPWVLVGNVFASAGRGAPGPVVGINPNWQILTANGDWFQGGCSADASFLGNVFDMTGVRVPGEEFVAFGGGQNNGPNDYAATNLGNVYRWDNCTAGSAWSYIGGIPPNGPTSANRQSWGGLKQIYR